MQEGTSSRGDGRGKRWWMVALGLLAVFIAVATEPVVRHVQAAALLLRFESSSSNSEGLAGVGVYAVDSRKGTLKGQHESWRVHRYRPRGADNAPGVLLVHGVHPEGIDETRLRQFARVMASSGLAVMTPEIEGLTNYRIEPEAIDQIGKVARAYARKSGRRAVGVTGISFSGGLALVAAEHPAYAPHMAFVLAVGGHHDLARVSRWYAGEPIEGPEGRAPPVDPHPYGAGVFVYSQIEKFFDPEDVAVAREALGLVLGGEWKPAQKRLPALSREGRERMKQLMHNEPSRALKSRFLELVSARRDELARVSPRGRLETLEVPTYLVHGLRDPIVPSTETRWLAHEMPDRTLKAVAVTPFLRHAEQQDQPTPMQRWELVHLMAEVLERAHETAK